MLYGLRQASTVLIVSVVLLDTYYLPQEDPTLAIVWLVHSTVQMYQNLLLKWDPPAVSNRYQVRRRADDS